MAYRVRRLNLLVLPLLAGLALSACQPSDSPADPPETGETTISATPSPSPTTSPEPTPQPATAEGPAENIPVPEMPELAKNNDEAGSLSFLHHYFDLMNYALDTYDPYPLIGLTSQYCEPCGDNFINPLGRHAEKGHWQVGGHYSLNTLAVEKPDGSTTLIIFSFTNDEQIIYSAPNQIYAESSGSAEEQFGTATLKFEDGWQVHDFDFTTEKIG